KILYVIRRIVLHGDRDRVVAAILQIVVVLDVVGHLRDAGHATGGPKLDQYNLATHILHGELFAFDGGEGYVRCRLGFAGDLPNGDASNDSDDGDSEKKLFHW